MNKNSLLSVFLTVILFAGLILTSISLYFESQLGAYADLTKGSDSWPMYRCDPQRTGYSSFAAPDTSELKWFYNTTVEVYSSPVVANGRVVMGLCNGTVLALNSTTGEKLWSYDTGVGSYSIWGSPAIDLGKVYIGTDDFYEPYDRNNLYCLNESTGELVWKYLAGLGHRINSSPLVSNDRLFFGAGCSVYCLDANDGSFIWNFTTDGEGSYNQSTPVNSSPAIFDDVLFVGSYYSRLYAINASTGVKIWSYSAGYDDYDYGGLDSSPVVYDGKVFYRSRHIVHCVDAVTGALIWNTSKVGHLFSSPAVANGKVFIGGNDAGIGKFFCFDASNGSSLWTSTIIEELSIVGSLFSSPAVADGKVFFGTQNGEIYCLDENTGLEIWSYQGLAEVFHSPAISDGTVFVTCGIVASVSDSRAGGVYAFGEKYRTSLSLSLDSETSLLGFKVYLSGTLEGNGAALGGASVVLSYSVTGGESWIDITTVQTSADGSYSAVWIPDATGTYIVKATWMPYPAFQKGESLRMLSVKNFDEQTVFSVTSNSTLSVLDFDSVSRELSFTVSGESGSTGFAKVTIAKSLVANIADLKVYLDGASLNYTADSTDTSWSLNFVYTHSTHSVTVNLGVSSPMIWPFATAVAVFAVVGACILVYFKKRKH